MEGGKAEAITKAIFNQETECHFAGAGKSGVKTAICSPKPILDTMKEFARKKGKHVSTDKHAVETVKDLLNCKSESCILKRADFISFAKNHNLEHILDMFFKPEGPSHNFNLLSNFNIDDVLDQFESKFSSRKFLHIPFQMRDFEKVGTQLSTIDLADEFSNGHQTFGVVLNTDYSNGRGIHWFCLFGELLKDKIVLEYFNSSGKEPLPEVQAWLQKNKHYLEKKMKMPCEIHYSTGIKFQSDEHSCGVYCLCYIWLRLENISPKWFNGKNFNDSLMHEARKKLFRHEN